MQRKKNEIQLPAFTVFEVTVVLALLSTIITIISVALNRFSEQLKNSAEVHQELNDWFAFRSVLWKELYTSDSVAFIHQEAHIYSGSRDIAYRAENEWLERKSGQEWVSTGIALESIESKPEEKGGMLVFHFKWKDGIMDLSYRQAARVKDKIDRYFEEANE